LFYFLIKKKNVRWW